MLTDTGLKTLFMHWDGTAWSGPIANTGGGSCLLGLASDDVYGGGLGLHHFDGTAWQVCETFPTFTSAAVRGLTVADDGTLFAVGFHNGINALGFAAIAEPELQGCPGAGGVTPQLSLSGTPMAGAPITIDLTGGPSGSSALVLFGLQAGFDLSIGASGCSLYVSPLLPITLTLPLGPTGAASLFGVIPSSASGRLGGDAGARHRPRRAGRVLVDERAGAGDSVDAAHRGGPG